MNAQNEFDVLVSEHIDGTPTVHSTQRLDKIIKSDPNRRKEFMDQVLIHQLLAEHWSTKPLKPRQSEAKPKPAFVAKKSPLQKLLGFFRKS